MPRISGYEKIGFIPGRSEENNVIFYLKKHMENFQDLTALRWATKEKLLQWDGNYKTDLPHEDLSFRKFYEKINRLARGLKDRGIKEGDCVVIFLPMSVELYQAMFAVLQIGGVAVFLDSWARRTHLGASASIVDPKAMISFEQAFLFCKGIPEIDAIPLKVCAFNPATAFDATINELEKSEPLTELTAVEQEQTALITFTTGSSGTPKGANRTHQFLSAQHKALDLTIPYTAEDVDLPAFPIFSLNNLASGVNTIIPAVDIGAPTPRDPLILVTQLRSCGATCTTLSPSMLVEIAAYCDGAGIQLDFLRRVVTGGAPISNDNLKAFKKIAPNAEIWVLYGSTEVEPIAHIEANDILYPKHKGNAEGDGVNVGHFAEGLEFKFIKIDRNEILDFDGESWTELEVPKGEVGEIIVSGLHVCKSYYNSPEATKKTKIVDSQNRVWHRTGDLGYSDQHGQLWIVGRVHNAIARAGQWYFPVKAEILLKKLKFAHRVAFLGIPDSDLGERTYAVIAPHKAQGASIETMEKEARKILEDNKIAVDRILLLDDIPMDPRHHSKVEYSVLRDKILDDETELNSKAAV